jgi:hypothetical protein
LVELSFIISGNMALKLILRETPTDLEPTPKQLAQRSKFAEAAKECRQHFAGSKLKGAARIRAMNEYMSRTLKS